MACGKVKSYPGGIGLAGSMRHSGGWTLSSQTAGLQEHLVTGFPAATGRAAGNQAGYSKNSWQAGRHHGRHFLETIWTHTGRPCEMTSHQSGCDTFKRPLQQGTGILKRSFIVTVEGGCLSCDMMTARRDRRHFSRRSAPFYVRRDPCQAWSLFRWGKRT